MAKKNEKPDAPVVTSLPLPSSDSVLVIDLPDGQKLLVGKMSPGSVIEVATWRGTGRPDSRTNRLMLGMSNSELDENSSALANENADPINKLSVAYVLYLLRNIPAFSVTVFRQIATKVKSLRHTSERKVAATNPEDDVQEWLNRITRSISSEQSNPAFGAEKSKKMTVSVKKATQKKNSSGKSKAKRA